MIELKIKSRHETLNDVIKDAKKQPKGWKAVFGKDNTRQFPDALIAATAWQWHGVLVTLNKKHFANIPINEFTVQVIDQDADDWVALLK